MIVTESSAGTSVQDDRYTAPAGQDDRYSASATPLPPQGRAPFVLPEGYVLSDWTPWPPSRWRPIVDEPVQSLSADDDLSIPNFLRR
jgi:hypothetical protein